MDGRESEEKKRLHKQGWNFDYPYHDALFYGDERESRDKAFIRCKIDKIVKRLLTFITVGT